MNGLPDRRRVLEADMLLEFHRLSLKVASIVKAYAATTDIGNSDCEALLVFWQAYTRGETLTASDLAARLNLTRGGATYLIDRLEAKGYITREADPNDRRRTLLTLSESGCGIGGGFSGNGMYHHISQAASHNKDHSLAEHIGDTAKSFFINRTDSEVELFISMLREIIDIMPSPGKSSAKRSASQQ